MGIFSKMMNSLVVKTLTEIKHTGQMPFFFRSSRPTVTKMQREVGTGLNANVIMAPIGWMQRNATEADPAIRQRKDDEPVETHPLLDLLDKPNPFYSGAHLTVATIFSFATAGNAYWLIKSSIGGKPQELWYTPHWLIEPKQPSDGSEFISHYNYSPGGGEQIRIEVEDVVHFRDGIDPVNQRLGLARLNSLIAEIWSDMEAGSFVAALLANGGVPGLIFSPRGEKAFSPETVESMKNYLRSQFSGTQRGLPLVSAGDVRLEEFGFDPAKMDLSSVRNTAEERACAILGIPAAVVGFGTGMQQTKVGATMDALRKEAWQGGILPILGGFAGEINRQLLPKFLRSEGLEMFYDSSKVPALVEDRNEFEKRVTERLGSGAITVNEYRQQIGLEELGLDGEIYLRSFNIVEVKVGTSGRTIESESGGVEPTDKSKGNGHDREAARLKAHTDDAHTALEQEVARTGRRIKRPPKSLAALANRIDAIRKQSGSAFEKRLQTFFEDLGKTAEASAKRVLKKGRLALSDEAPLMLTKQGEADLADQIVAGMDMADRIPIFEELFEKTYLSVANDTAKAMEGTIGLVTGVPDPVARAVTAAGGRRAGLIDLTKQSKDATFKALTEAAAEGLGPEAAARRIRDQVGGGPWKDAKTRARVVARTEMAFSTNVSSLELGKSIGAEEALIFDARLGSTDATCEALNGRVASLSDARGLMFDEHPNGTRSFTPIPPTMEL